MSEAFVFISATKQSQPGVFEMAWTSADLSVSPGEGTTRLFNRAWALLVQQNGPAWEHCIVTSFTVAPAVLNPVKAEDV